MKTSQRHLDARERMDPRWFMELPPEHVKFAAQVRTESFATRIKAAIVRLLVG